MAVPAIIDTYDLVNEIAAKTGIIKDEVEKVIFAAQEVMGKNVQEQFATLCELTETIISNLDLDSVLFQIAEKTTMIMNAKACSVRLLDRTKENLIIMSAYGLSDLYLKKGPVEILKSALDREVISGKVVSIKNAATDSKFQYAEEAKMEGIKSVLCVPLKVMVEVIGVMRIYTSEIKEFTPAEINFLSAMANISAIAIHNAKMYEKLKKELEYAELEMSKIYW